MTTWTRAALVRAIKTSAQTAVSLLTVGAVGILDVDWLAVLSASALAGIVSVLTSLTGLPEAEPTVTRLDPADAPDPDTLPDEPDVDEPSGLDVDARPAGTDTEATSTAKDDAD